MQIFVWCNSKYIDVYRVATDHDVSHTLQENMMNQEAMEDLLAVMQETQPARKSETVFVCTVSNPTLANLTINTKTMLSTVLGTSKMS